MNGLTAMGALFGLGAAAVAFPLMPVPSMVVPAGAATSAASAPLAAVASELPMEEAAALSGCVLNFSKDNCGGEVQPGDVKVYGCDGWDCRTITVTDAVYKTTFRTSGGVCGLDCIARCDDMGDEMDGDLVLKFDYTMRMDSCCPYRGFWSGRWEYTTAGGQVFKGVAHGTLGVGTNRVSECYETPDACERCYDVQFDGRVWDIAMEGSFQGRDERGNLLNFTTDGHWTVKNTPDMFAQPFKAYSRNDGSLFINCN